jgi:23S rRNA (adenine-N6)-dimethyltransferase
LVIDVGAGKGALTAELVARGARVIAVESHPGRADELRERFGSSIVVVRADARDLRLPRRPFHVVANPPFSITTPLLRRLLHSGSRLLSARVVVQEQAGRRWAARDAPAVRRWGSTFAIGLGPRVPRRAFDPEPHVDARILVVQRRR